MPSIGSINQNVFKFLFNLFEEDSSETIGISGVISLIFLVRMLFTSISPLVTGVLSDLIFLINPFFLSSIAISPALRKVLFKSFTIFFFTI